MAEYFAFQAALCFASTFILARRGLETSNAITGSFISLSSMVLTLWILIPFFVPLSTFRTPAVWYFIADGIVAPGLGRLLSYVGIERIGVARAVPIISCSPLFASILAVLLIGESWTTQNFLGTALVIFGVVILSGTGAGKKSWRKMDIIYPLVAAFSFGISSNLRKLGLLISNLPLMAAAVTSTTALLFAVPMLRVRMGRQGLQLSRGSFGWFFASGIANTGAMLSTFYALGFGKVVVVEPLVASSPVLVIVLTAIFLRDLEVITPRVVAGATCTVLGTILVVTLKGS